MLIKAAGLVENLKEDKNSEERAKESSLSTPIFKVRNKNGH